MDLSRLILSASALLLPAAVSLVGIQVCYNSGFTECISVLGDAGHCLYVTGSYNGHVYSARAESGTSRCDSYNHINKGACGGLLVEGIDQAGYSGLPFGHLTSGFVCYY